MCIGIGLLCSGDIKQNPGPASLQYIQEDGGGGGEGGGGRSNSLRGKHVMVTWLGIILVCSDDIKHNPDPASLPSSGNLLSSSDISTNIFSVLNCSYNVSFVQYNVQSILNKLDFLQAEFFEFDTLAFQWNMVEPVSWYRRLTFSVP